MRKCELCKSGKQDEVRYGEFLTKRDLSVHTYCLYLTSNLSQCGEDHQGFYGFMPAAIKQESRRLSRLTCHYCHKANANIGCCAAKCRRSFHLICGLEHGAANTFKGTFQSFCDQHVPPVRYRPARDELCCICYDGLLSAGSADGRFSSVDMLRAPCCRSGWFHKLCLQKFARTAGYFFKCPLCNDNGTFCETLAHRGIFIPKRDAAWELDPNAFSELLERPNSCTAAECQNKRGRMAQSERNPLLLCATCGSVAMHQFCTSGVASGGRKDRKNDSFNCDDCEQFLSANKSNESLEHQQQNEQAASSTDENDEKKEEDNEIEDLEVDVCTLSDAESDIVINAAVTRRIADDTLEEVDSKDESIIAPKKLYRCDDESDANAEVESPTTDKFKHVTTRRNGKNNAKRYSDDDEIQDDKAEVDSAKITEAVEVKWLFKDVQNDKENSKEYLVKKATGTNFIITDNDDDDDSSSNSDEDDDDNDDGTYGSKIRSFVMAQRLRQTSGTDSSEINCDDAAVSANLPASTSAACDNKPTLVSATISKRISVEATDSSDDDDDDEDDPLENFVAFLAKKKKSQNEDGANPANKSCIASHLRRNSEYSNSDEVPIADLFPEAQTLFTQNRSRHCEINKENVEQILNSENSKPQSTSKSIKEEPKAEKVKEAQSPTKLNALDFSCIARRTRRKSLHVQEEYKFEQEEAQKGASNILDISCIAKRTRRKSLYFASPTSEIEAQNATNCSFKSDTFLENDYCDTSDSASSFHSACASSNSSETYAPSNTTDNRLEISCIGNRTRRRESLRLLRKTPTRLSLIPETPPSSLSSSLSNSSSNSSSSFSSASLGSFDSGKSTATTEAFQTACSSNSSHSGTSSACSAVSNKRSKDSPLPQSSSCISKRLRRLPSTDVDNDDECTSSTSRSGCSSFSSAFGSKLRRPSRRSAATAVSSYTFNNRHFDPYITPTFIRVDGKLKRVPTHIATMDESADTSADNSSAKMFWKSYGLLAHSGGSSGCSSSDEHPQQTRIQRSRGSSNSNSNSSSNYSRDKNKCL